MRDEPNAILNLLLLKSNVGGELRPPNDWISLKVTLASTQIRLDCRLSKGQAKLWDAPSSGSLSSWSDKRTLEPCAQNSGIDEG